MSVINNILNDSSEEFAAKKITLLDIEDIETNPLNKLLNSEYLPS